MAVSAFVIALMAIVATGVVSGSPTGVLAALSPLWLILPAGLLARRIGRPWNAAVGTPFVMPVFICALVNSTFKTLSQGGIRWRQNFYSLDTLRAGGVR